MKKATFLLIAILLLPALTLVAQEVDTLQTQTSDTTKVRFGNKVVTFIEDGDENVDIKIRNEETGDVKSWSSDEDDDGKKKDKSKFEGHWKGFEFGFNGLVNADNKFPAADNQIAINMVRSWTFGLNLFQKDIPLIGDNFGLVTGLGMQWKNYHFDNEVRLTNIDDVLGTEDLSSVEIEKNRLQATYLTIPVAFELQFPVGPKKHEFFILAGGYGSFKLGSNYKTEWVEDDRSFEDKIKAKANDYQLSKFDYGLTARIGIEDINLFATYSMSSLFEEGSGMGADAYAPVTVGLTIIGF